jgi:hypothetical protein
MGDALSRQLTGTDSTIGVVAAKGKKGFEGKVQHKKVEIGRFFLNTYAQNPMQQAIETILGKSLNQGFL